MLYYIYDSIDGLYASDIILDDYDLIREASKPVDYLIGEVSTEEDIWKACSDTKGNLLYPYQEIHKLIEDCFPRDLYTPKYDLPNFTNQINQYNAYGLNKKLKFYMSSSKMLNLGFKKIINSDNCYYIFHKEMQGDEFSTISFNLFYFDQPIDGCKLFIYIIDNSTQDIYNYEKYICEEPNGLYSRIIYEWVEDTLLTLKESGLLYGHDVGRCLYDMNIEKPDFWEFLMNGVNNYYEI